MCQVSRLRCNFCFVLLCSKKNCGQSDGASCWMVFYQRGLPCLVYLINKKIATSKHDKNQKTLLLIILIFTMFFFFIWKSVDIVNHFSHFLCYNAFRKCTKDTSIEYIMSLVFETCLKLGKLQW